MERLLLSELIRWKENPGRKPLILRGARQTGKTWLMKAFASESFNETAYINFEQNKNLAGLFRETIEVETIIQALQVQTGKQINPETTLIIFDEIQEAPEAITALKYFCENAPGYCIVAAGSLLGVALHRSVSFPVGKVDFMDVYPMNFHEFLMALGEEKILELIKNRQWELLKVFKQKLTERLRQYYIVGGMPEAVAQFSRNGDVQKVRQIQKNILEAYELDFSKHAPQKDVPRIRMVWNSIPGQLAREKRKFVYSHIKEGARAKDFEIALAWLKDCGQVLRIHRVSKPGLPLKAYEDVTAFKLFLIDIGLLGAMSGLSPKIILKGNAVFTEFKGALTEQYVCQELKSRGGLPIFYWSADRGTSEIDFIIQAEDKVIPIEVKAEENLKSKSLKVYQDKFSPTLAVRTSLSDFRDDANMHNIPLWGFAGWLDGLAGLADI